MDGERFESIEQRVDEASTSPASAERNRSFAARWKHGELFDSGYVPVPSHFLLYYSRLKPHPLTANEAMFVLQLMSFKWTAEHPYPSYARLAERMGVSTKMVRRYAASLEKKNYLVRHQREGKQNSFDLTRLFDALRRTMFWRPQTPAEEETIS
jgi:predicted transcriptional regulator